MTRNYWLSIGRNVGDEPMSDADWNNYRAELARLATRHGDTITSVRGGISRWNETDEDTFLLLVAIADRFVASTMTELARLARDYEQDGIGMVGGNVSSIVWAADR